MTTPAHGPTGKRSAVAQRVADRVAARMFTLLTAVFVLAVISAGALDAAGIPELSLARVTFAVAAATGGAVLVARAWEVEH